MGWTTGSSSGWTGSGSGWTGSGSGWTGSGSGWTGSGSGWTSSGAVKYGVRATTELEKFTSLRHMKPKNYA